MGSDWPSGVRGKVEEPWPKAVTTKYSGATTAAEACKAYDDVLAAIKG